MGAERVAIEVWAARGLVDGYRAAARRTAEVAGDGGRLIAAAADLLGSAPTQATALLEGLAIDLAYDADDLDWRVDLIVAHDGRSDGRGKLVAELPERRPAYPAHSPQQLAALMVGLLESQPPLLRRDRELLATGLSEFVRSSSPERWGQVVDFWRSELRESEPELSRDLLDLTRTLDRHQPRLTEIAEALDELARQKHDPSYMAAFFAALGPGATAAVPSLLADSAYAEALASRRDPVYSADPIELRDSFAESFAVATRGTTRTRHGNRGYVLTRSWLDELFEHATWTYDPMLGADRVYLNDAFAHLFAAGEFRTEVAVRAGRLGLDVFDHQVRVDRGSGSPMFDGFSAFETNWEDRAGLLTGAAARQPEAAAAVLIAESRSGRSGAEIVADRSYDNMDRAVVARHYADLVLAGTVVAETRVLADGFDIDRLRDPLLAKAALIEAVAEQVVNDSEEAAYPEAVNGALSQMVAQTMPHLVQVLPHGGGRVSVDLGRDATGMPSLEAGIYVDPQYANNLFGALFRVEADRRMLIASLVLAQREAYALDPSPGTIRRVGQTDGSMVSGLNIAGIDNAEMIAREIDAANDLVDSLWNGTDFVLGVVPVPAAQALSKTVDTIDDGLGAIGIDPLEDFVHGDSKSVIQDAEREAESNLFGIAPRARRFVFGHAFETMQAEYRQGGLDNLSDTSRAIFDHMSAESDLSTVFVPGISSVADFTQAGGEVSAEYDQAAGYLIDSSSVLHERYREYTRGSERSWPALSTD